MRAIPRAVADAGAWDSFCDESGEAWLFHRNDWIDVEVRYVVERDLSFGVVDGAGNIVGLLPLYIYRKPLGGFVEMLLASGSPRIAGPAFRSDLNATDRRAAQAAMMQKLFEVASINDVDRIQLGVQVLAPDNRSGLFAARAPFWISDYGFERGLSMGESGLAPAPGMATYAAEQLVNLDGAESSLFDALDSSCRRAVRKAEKSRATFRTGVGDAALQDYADLAEVSASRTGQALPPLDFYAAIMSGLRAGGRTHCFFVDVDGELAAGLIVLAYKNALSFLANASHPDFLHARVNDYIHWQTIRWAHANGYEIYRLGPYFPTVPKGWPIEQVSRFKKKFSNMEVEQVQGSFFRKRAQYRLIGKQLLDLLCCEKGMSSL